MPQQILPIQGLDQAGLIKDQPAAALPPHAFSDVRNVRFRDNCVQKMEGELNIFPELFDSDQAVKYIAWWPNPNLRTSNTGYYLVIAQHADTDGNQRDHAYIIKPGDTELRAQNLKGTFQPDSRGKWQHTFFQGGYALIINQGIDEPQYILDPDGNIDIAMVPQFAKLPGWEDYNITQVILDDTFEEGNAHTFDLGQAVQFPVDRISVEEVNADLTVETYTAIAGNPAGTGTVNDTDFVPGTLPATVPVVTDSDAFAIYNDTETNTTVIQLSETTVTAGKRIRVVIRSREIAEIRCGVIRTFGDFLVAGDIREVEADDPDVVIRALPGTIRTSDVAAPGSVPNNWDPNAAGVSTANEFTTTQSGIVQDMVQLQGQLYIYSNDGIHVMPNPGGGVPQQPQPVAEGWGAQTTHAVIEFDGTHFVVGAQDIYLFSGHPGNIQSVADGRVREYFYDNLNPLHEQRMFCLRNRPLDEIWICYPTRESTQGELDEALVWNYRKNTWSTRDLYNVRAGDIGPIPGGGVPSVEVDIDGDTGDSGITNIGAREVQALSIDPATTLEGDDNFGEKTIYTVEPLATLPQFHVDGLPIYDIDIGPNFDTGDGTGNPMYFSATGFNAIGDQTFFVEIELPYNITTKAQLLAVFDTDSEFQAHLDREDITNSTTEFVIEATQPSNTRGMSVTFGNQQDVARGNLTRDSDLDLFSDSDTQVYETETISGTTYNRVTYSVYIGSDRVGSRYYMNPLTGDTDFIWRYHNARGYAQDMYDGMTPTQLAANNMYGTGRGGTLQRPLRPEENSQFMYRVRGDTESDFEITEPWIPLGPGVYTFSILVPTTTTWTRQWRMEAYGQPSIHDGNADVNLALDVTRHRNLLGDEAVNGAAPILEFREARRRFDVMTDRYVTQTETVVGVSLYGNYTGSDDVRTFAAARQIATDFEDHDTIYNGFSDSEIATLTSRLEGKYNLRLAGIGGNPHGVSTGDFLITRTQEGKWPTRSVLLPGDDTDTFEVAVYPTFRLRLQADNNESITADIPVVNTNTGSFGTITAAQIIDQIIDVGFDDSDSVRGWSSTILPQGYSQPTTHTNVGIITTINAAANSMDTERLSRRPINASWTIQFATRGNKINRDTDDWFNDANFTWSYGNTTINGVTVDNTIDFRGSFVSRATPSYIGFLVHNPDAPVASQLETLILHAGENGTYDPDTHLGTNGVTLTAEQAAEKWINEIRIANRRLQVVDRGVNGEFLVLPTNYSETANFVFEVAANDSATGAARIKEFGRFNGQTNTTTIVDVNGVPTEVYINPSSSRLHSKFPGDTDFGQATNAPAVAGTLDSQIAIDPLRRPDRTTRETLATYLVNNQADLEFDALRPWPKTEVNYNLYYPLFGGSTAIADTDQQGVDYLVNKITAADIGWSIPTYSLIPRDTYLDGTKRRFRNPGSNDYPQPYVSQVTRSQLPLSPEFETEQVQSIALWMDGVYRPYVDTDAQYSKLVVTAYGTNNPADTSEGNRMVTNTFYVTEDYKIDLRVHGRFINLKWSDEDAMTGATETYEDKTFSKEAPWRVSGAQLDITAGGTR